MTERLVQDIGSVSSDKCKCSNTELWKRKQNYQAVFIIESLNSKITHILKTSSAYMKYSDGGGVFIYLCSQTIKGINTEYIILFQLIISANIK